MSRGRSPVLIALASLVTASVVGAGTAVLLVGGDGGPPLRQPAAAAADVPARPSPSPSPRRKGADGTPATAPPGPVHPTAPARTPTGPAGPPALTAAALRSAPVSVCGRSGRLQDGRLAMTGAQPGVELVDAAIGDLDGDGADEAAAVLACTMGNSVVSEVLVYQRGPTLVGRVPVEAGVDGEVGGHEVRLSGGVLDVSARFVTEQDARCCPSGVVVRQYRLRGDRLERLAGPGVDRGARLTSGAGWSTIRVGDTYEQLARVTGLPVTVTAYEQGDPHEAGCADVALGDSTGTHLLGGDGRVQSVVVHDPAVLTGAGLGVGSTERQVLAAYGGRTERVDNVYGSTDDVVLPTGGGQVVRFEFDEDQRVRVVHAGEEGYAMAAEGCH